jgi:peroxiredoxin
MSLIGSEYKILQKGEIAPNFSLPATNGKTYSLKDFSNKKAVLIIFMCNHCPYVIPKIDEINRIAQDFKDKGLIVVGINSNESENYPEDSFEKMQEYTQKWNAEFLYLHDESQEVAKAYGAVCTPDPFLLVNCKDHERKDEFKLVFHSRIDDNHGDTGSSEEMYKGVRELLDTGKVTLEEQASMGCSIKWID